MSLKIRLSKQYCHTFGWNSRLTKWQQQNNDTWFHLWQQFLLNSTVSLWNLRGNQWKWSICLGCTAGACRWRFLICSKSLFLNRFHVFALCSRCEHTEVEVKSNVCPWISLPSNHPAANPSCTEVWWPSHCVSVYLPHSKCVLLIKLIIRVKQWQVIKSQTVITAANYRDAHKHELEDGSLQVPSICFPIKIFFQFYSTVMFIHCKTPQGTFNSSY